MVDLLGTVAQWLREEWTQVKAAPGAFVLALVVGLAVGWLAGSAFYAERIETMSQRIESRDDDIKKLQGRNEELERQLAIPESVRTSPPTTTTTTTTIAPSPSAYQEPLDHYTVFRENLLREPTAQAREGLVPAIRALGPDTIHILSVEEPMSGRVARAMEHLFEDADWTVTRGSAHPGDRGIFLVSDGSPGGQAKRDALASAFWGVGYGVNGTIMDPEFPEVGLVIGGDPIREMDGYATKIHRPSLINKKRTTTTVPAPRRKR